MSKVETMQFLLSYKIKQCRDSCVPKNWNECHKFHSEQDQRRFPLKIPLEIFSQHKALVTKLKTQPNYSIGLLFEEII